jgi:transposase
MAVSIGDSAMTCRLSLSTVVPTGLAVDHQELVDGILIVTASARASSAACPSCDRLSHRVHSRYHRRVADLPLGGHAVQLRLATRRFRCDERECRRQIFAERFGTAAPERSRRTGRMEEIVHHLGLALGGRPGVALAARLMLPVSNDTLLRVVRRRAHPRTALLTVVGVDDWAFRRNHRYGTIVCDLERHRIVKLLPDREIATVAAWLVAHPCIRVVSRDRGGGYGEAAARALPDAIQVADRWHLMENASSTFLEAVSKSMKPIRAALGATVVDPNLLTCAERLQYEGYLRREETNAIVAELAADGVSIKEIVR